MSGPHKRPLGQQPPKQQQQQRQPADQEPIPPLQSLAPSIFVPIRADPAATPFVPPATAAARLGAVLAAFDAHAAHVRANMLALVRRECVRILREATAAEAGGGGGGGGGSGEKHPPRRHRPEGDVAAMLANMQAPHEARARGNVEIPPPDFSRVQPASVREEATRDLMSSVSRALKELRAFDAHMAGNRAVYEQALRRELEVEAR